MLGLLLLAAVTADAQWDEAREVFRQAYAAARAGGHSTADEQALSDYLLYPYLQAARLAYALSVAVGPLGDVDTETRDFIARHDPEPLSRRLRADWLASLARRRQWQPFLDIYVAEASSARSQCQYLEARIETEQLEGLAPLIVARWLTGSQLPIECEPVFQWLRDEGLLTDAHIEQRLTLLLENGQAGFARIIARRLPPEREVVWSSRARFVDAPRRALDAWLDDPALETDMAVVLDGWSRLSRNEPLAALDRAESMLATAGSAHASAIALSLALGLAWDRQPEAISWFARVAASDLDDYAKSWLVRAALWAGDWQLVADAIQSMSEATRAAAAWRYWAARAARENGQRRLARERFTELLPEDNYYAAMAARHLRRAAAPNPEVFAADSDVVRRLSQRPALVRARELLAVGLRSEATLEWRYAYAELDPAERRQSIHVAADMGLYDVAVATATRHEIFADYALLYPRPYDAEVARASQASGLEASLIYALLRQESLFRHDAVSAAGGRGLAQLQLATARSAARRIGAREPTRSELFEPAVSIALGAAELGHLIERFGGQLPVALAAYNAGPGAASRWWPSEPREADIWIENIPFNETRAYVRRVLWHSLVFRWLEEGRGVGLDAWAESVVRPAQN